MRKSGLHLIGEVEVEESELFSIERVKVAEDASSEMLIDSFG